MTVVRLLPDHPWVRTTDWTYIPFRGPDALNVKCWGRYGPERLEPTPGTATEWLDAGCDVYAYFNNDWHGHAVKDAIDLREALTG